MARAFSAVERREYVRAVIRITRHQGRLTTAEAMKKLGLSRATVQRYFAEAEATGRLSGMVVWGFSAISGPSSTLT
ncbi:DUF977 family protein [Klebsiella pneumoniae]|uniref:DUF977 family protein n=1 Tax=Klebsiella pneumoniae TaxID=573 RepID=UPI002A01E77A|nr:DUF977 family protein [Klebsiella pneumoniae]